MQRRPRAHFHYHLQVAYASDILRSPRLKQSGQPAPMVMATLLTAHAILCQGRERLLERVLQRLGAPDTVLLRVLAWERLNHRRARRQLLTVDVFYRWILLRECWNWWNNPWKDLD
jgi:hypothetical protein